MTDEDIKKQLETLSFLADQISFNLFVHNSIIEIFKKLEKIEEKINQLALPKLPDDSKN